MGWLDRVLGLLVDTLRNQPLSTKMAAHLQGCAQRRRYTARKLVALGNNRLERWI
jgi:hypothetical protein